MKLDRHDYIGKVWNKSDNIYRNYRIIHWNKNVLKIVLNVLNIIGKDYKNI